MVPLARRKHVKLAPATAASVSLALARPGGSVAWPAPLAPQQTGAIAGLSAQAWPAPLTICVAPVMLAGAPVTAEPVPQHTTLPVDAVNAQEWLAPAATAATPPAASTAGGDSCAEALEPQHCTKPPAAVTAHAWSTPTARDATAPATPSGAGGVAWSRVASPQHSTADECVSAQEKPAPAPMASTPQAALSGASHWPKLSAPVHCAAPQSSTMQPWPAPSETRAPSAAAQASSLRTSGALLLGVRVALREELAATVRVPLRDDVGEAPIVREGVAATVMLGVAVVVAVGEPTGDCDGVSVATDVGVFDVEEEGAGYSAALYGGMATPRKKELTGAVASTATRRVLPFTRNSVACVQAYSA